MDAIFTPTKMTAQEYLQWESTQDGRHEFIGGDVFAISGARVNHNVIAGSLFVLLKQALRGLPGRVFIADTLQVEQPHPFGLPMRDVFDGAVFDAEPTAAVRS